MSLRWRFGSVLALVLLFGYLGAANFVSEERREAAWYLPDEGLRLGLDLQGGIHMVIGPDLDDAIGHELSAIENSIENQLEREGIRGTQFVLSPDRLVVRPDGSTNAEKIRALLAEYETVEIESGDDPYEIRLRLTDEWDADVRERAMLQVLEVLRRRVDDPQTGIPESVITRQGADRVLVQIPGVSRVPKIFGTTGKLEFKIVEDFAATEDLLRAKLPDGAVPEGKEIVAEIDRETDRVLSAYLVPQVADITGEYLTDARVGFDSRFNEWQVNFTWNADGGEIFGELTGANVNKPLAIILDSQVYSAPVIESRISRQGVIRGSFDSEQASDLAVILRAGALPIDVTIEEERTIGPALGADSISRGLWASLGGLLVVIAFAIGYYKRSGLYAAVSLGVNLVLLLGLMSLFEGTLTLPGIAGLVLTVGMAIDANVIIFERIREELRSGRAPRAAVATGFQKARWTILDANLTTLFTAIILFNYGTGPIKGFAVTLSVGILTSVFAALVLTRLLYEWYPGQRPVEQLSI
ncbi:MAG: protein translocase subunit SecD [Myxococcota bacterium]|nr:protein translocase subunit SecD [Myxococcota bacterium]